MREAPTPARYRTALDCPLWSPLEEPPLRAVDCLRYRSPMADLQLEESVEGVQGRKGHNNRRENRRLTRRMEVLDVGAAWNMRGRRDDDDRDGMG